MTSTPPVRPEPDPNTLLPVKIGGRQVRAWAPLPDGSVLIVAERANIEMVVGRINGLADTEWYSGRYLPDLPSAMRRFSEIIAEYHADPDR